MRLAALGKLGKRCKEAVSGQFLLISLALADHELTAFFVVPLVVRFVLAQFLKPQSERPRFPRSPFLHPLLVRSFLRLRN